MILTEPGLRVVRDGDRWRCVERPDVVTLRGGRYRVTQQEFATLYLALADRHSAEFVRGNPRAARSARG